MRVKIFIVIFSIILALAFGAKSCASRDKDSKTGSSNPNTFAINSPSNLTATANSSFQINLFWSDNSNNEDGFAIERKMWTVGSWIRIATLAADEISYSDNGLYSSTTYYYRICAFNDIGDTSFYSNETDSTTFAPSWVTVAAGGFHAVALSNENTIWTWGYNNRGQLGVGNSLNNFSPNPVTTARDWSRIAAGASHTLALKTDKTFWAWGYNAYGQVGYGDTLYDNWEPYQIGSDSDWVNIGAGGVFTFGIKDNGSLWGCGYNAYGQLGIGNTFNQVLVVPVGTDKDWISIGPGVYHSIAMKTNNTIWGFGRNDQYQLGLGDNVNRWTPTQIGTESDWVTALGGDTHTVGLKTNGFMFGWGINISGQLGLPDTNTRRTPTQLGTESDWSRISTGYSSTFGIKNNGTIWSWGNNTCGLLGHGDTVARNSPTQIGSDSDWLLISGSSKSTGSFSLAITSNGNIWTWGYNFYGQLGLGDTLDRYTPAWAGFPVPNPPINLTTSSNSATNINLVWSDMSYNEEGFRIERKLGRAGTWAEITTVDSNINYYSDTVTPSAVAYYYRIRAYNIFGNSVATNEAYMATAGNWLAGWGGDSHSVVLKTNGTIWGCGGNNFGQIGFGDTIARITFTQVGTNTDWAVVSARSTNTIACKTNGTIWGCGRNDYGQVGVGDTDTKYSLTQIGTDSDWLIAVPGTYHALGLKITGAIYSWGSNSNGELGLGDSVLSAHRNTPTMVGTDTNWVSISGAFHSLARKNNGTIWGWGSTNTGQLGIGEVGMGKKRISPTQIGTDSDWSMLVAGGGHTIALKDSGFVWTWGSNTNGQLGQGDSTTRATPTQMGTESNWISITAGASFCIARKINGIVYSWGSNTSGELGLNGGGNRNTPTQIGLETDWVFFGAGSSHTISRKANGTLWLWGRNNEGELGLNDTSNRLIPTLVGE